MHEALRHVLEQVPTPRGCVAVREPCLTALLDDHIGIGPLECPFELGQISGTTLNGAARTLRLSLVLGRFDQLNDLLETEHVATVSRGRKSHRWMLTQHLRDGGGLRAAQIRGPEQFPPAAIRTSVRDCGRHGDQPFPGHRPIGSCGARFRSARSSPGAPGNRCPRGCRATSQVLTVAALERDHDRDTGGDVPRPDQASKSSRPGRRRG